MVGLINIVTKHKIADKKIEASHISKPNDKEHITLPSSSIITTPNE